MSVSICGECKGKGSYKVYNAYDPNFEEDVICEYCDGQGTFDEDSLDQPFPTRKPEKTDHWVN